MKTAEELRHDTIERIMQYYNSDLFEKTKDWIAVGQHLTEFLESHDIQHDIQLKIDVEYLDKIYEDCEEVAIQGCEFYLRGLESGYEHRKLTIIDTIDEEIAKYPLLFQEAIQALTKLKNKL